MASDAQRSGDELASLLRGKIRDIPDFPRAGIVFKDITPLLLDAPLFRRVTEALAGPFAADRISHVIAVEARGFILGAPVAQHLEAAFVPMRKPGKLPHETERLEYALEYGVDALEVHRDALQRGDRVLLVDDVLATGGTASAACRIVEALGAEVVGCSFLIVLSFLPGQEALTPRRVEKLLSY